MIYKDFKGLKLSALGFGTMRLPKNAEGQIDQQTVNDMIALAMENGVNYYDTAYPYMDSKSEISVGEALSRYPRESFYLADKYPGHQNVKGVSELDPQLVFEDQLKKCGVEYFDFYLMHNINESSIPFYLAEDANYIEYFLEQKRLGRIKHLGFSCHAELDGLKQYVERYGEYMEFCQIQLNYLDWSFQKAKEKVEYLNSVGLPVWVMEPVRGGKLAKLDAATEEKMRAFRPEDSIASWAFRWLQTVPQPTMILSGMTYPEQVEDNLKTFSEEKPLSEAELGLIYEAADKLAALIPCTGCRYCCDGCPMELDIPFLLNLSNDLRLDYSINIVARYHALGQDKLASACIGCGQCTNACPQHIDVPGELAAFAEKMEKFGTWNDIAIARNSIANEMLGK